MAVIPVPYEYDGKPFEGTIVYDDSVEETRPAIFMQPDWLGVCDHSNAMAAEVAGRDYIVLVADMFGVGYGAREKTYDELLESAVSTRDNLPFVLGCGSNAFETLMDEADRRGLIDRTRTGAIGYCMGGGFALEQARDGLDVQGTVVFHVTRPNPLDTDAKPNIKGRVLAIHGAADPVTPKPMMDALEDELTGAGVDWQILNFGHAMHSFCVEGENNPPMTQYDEALCRRSYRYMRDFFTETF